MAPFPLMDVTPLTEFMVIGFPFSFPNREGLKSKQLIWVFIFNTFLLTEKAFPTPFEAFFWKRFLIIFLDCLLLIPEV